MALLSLSFFLCLVAVYVCWSLFLPLTLLSSSRSLSSCHGGVACDPVPYFSCHLVCRNASSFCVM